MLLCSGFKQWKSDNDDDVPPARVKGIATGEKDSSRHAKSGLMM
jgi:hypothetical protein